jgi:hypothetical protein
MPLMESKGLLVSLALLAAASPVLAELGGSADTVEADQQHMMAQRRALAATAYTVQEMSMPGGTVVREYVSAAGVVFAVTWNGPQMPDLKQLFGSRYFAEAQSAATKQGVRHGPVRVQQTDLVVHSGGHMRSYFGRAYVPQLVPEGVSADELE